MGDLESQSQSFIYWLFTSLALSLEAEGFVAKDDDKNEEFVHFIQLSANFKCSRVDVAHLFLWEKCKELYVSHLPASISMVQKDEPLSY